MLRGITLIVSMFVLALFSAFTPAANAGTISTNFGDGQTYGSYSTSKTPWKYGPPSYRLDSNIQTPLEVDWVGLYIQKWTTGDTAVHVFMQFSVKDNSYAADTLSASQSMNISIDGRAYQSYLASSYWQDYGGKGFDGPAALAYAWGSVNFDADGVSYISGNFGVGTGWSIDQDGNILDSWKYYLPSWDISFASAKYAESFATGLEALGATTVNGGTVPEPASFGLITIGGALILIRRKRR